MKRTLLSTAALGSALALAALLVPGIAAAAGPIPASTACTSPGPTVFCDLWAKTGTATMPGGASITTWGFAPSSAAAPSVPGPVLIVNEGDDVTLTLHNTLARPTSIVFGGQSMVPDTTGAASGGTAVYSFTAGTPGTYLYEAGLIPGAEYQPAMGLYGTLIVRPAGAPGQAYGDASTAFDDEALVVVGEFDPALTNSATPWTFDLRRYAPKWFLVNGMPYSGTASAITTTSGNDLLLRYVNAGLQHHSIGALGLTQRVLAADGSELPAPRTMVAETLAPGQSADVLVTVPVTAEATTTYAIYDASMLLNNSSANGIGGMLALVDATGTPSGVDTIGPVTSGVAVDTGTGLLTASITDAATGASGTGAAEYFIDATGAGGTGTPMTGPFPADPAAVTATIPPATLAALGTGTHTINVHGQDAVLPTGNWGAFSSVTFTVDQTGPTVFGLTLTPNPSNGSAPVALAGTASDTATGNSNVTAAEYFLGAPGADGAGQVMALNKIATTVSLTATITSPVGGDVFVHAKDAGDRWGVFSKITLTIDSTGPVASDITVSPDPTNGKTGVNASTAAVRVSAMLSDAANGGSLVTAGEAFIDTPGANGAGITFVSTDGSFNQVAEAGFADIPLTTISQLSDGSHNVLVHGKDAAGNWGALVAKAFTVDKTGPVVSALSATPNPTNSTVTPFTSATAFVLHANATDATTSVAGGEWWEGADPGVGKGTAFSGLDATIDFVALDWAAGNHTINARARDVLGNWGSTATVVVAVVLPDAVFANSFGSGNTSAWQGVTGTASQLSVTAGASLDGTPAFGMQTTLGGTAARYVTNTTPRLDGSYHAQFRLNPHGALLANNNATNGTTILAGLNAAGNTVFQVQMRRQNTGGGTYQLRLLVTRAGGSTGTTFTTITNAAHRIGVVWQSAASASASLLVDGVSIGTLSGLNTSASLLDSVRLGPSGNLVGGATGTLYFDAFVSTRRSAAELLP
jgi:FtsP/CotA-like multicopper oxidase with cupredoxin domain